MFNHLSDFSFVRNTKQAIGFYIAYFLLTLIAAMIVGAIAGVLFATTEEEAYALGGKLGTALSIIIAISLSALVIQKKQIWSFLTVVIVLIAAALATLLGGIFGVMPAAYLTTFAKKNSADDVTDEENEEE